MTLTGKAEPTPVLKDTNSYAHSTDLILRGLGLTYLIAFASLAWQLSGLFGSAGVTPIARTLDHYFNQVGLPALAHIPTLFWFSAHDAVLHAVCLGGIVLAGLLLLRFWTFPSLIALWIFYLSFVTPGGPFLSFQWDSFLLEFGFLGILAAVPSLRRSSPPHAGSSPRLLPSPLAPVSTHARLGRGQTGQWRSYMARWLSTRLSFRNPTPSFNLGLVRR